MARGRNLVDGLVNGRRGANTNATGRGVGGRGRGVSSNRSGKTKNLGIPDKTGRRAKLGICTKK